jgi:dCTP deaminase
LQSLAGINKKIKDLDKSLTDRVHSIEREQTYYRFIAVIVVAVVLAMITGWIRDGGLSRLLSPAPSAVQSGPANTSMTAPASAGKALPQKPANGLAKP